MGFFCFLKKLLSALIMLTFEAINLAFDMGRRIYFFTLLAFSLILYSIMYFLTYTHHISCGMREYTNTVWQYNTELKTEIKNKILRENQAMRRCKNIDKLVPDLCKLMRISFCKETPNVLDM